MQFIGDDPRYADAAERRGEVDWERYKPGKCEACGIRLDNGEWLCSLCADARSIEYDLRQRKEQR